MTLTLYRVTDPGDNIGNVPADEQIAFNGTLTADVNTEGAFMTDYEIKTTTGIGNNQAAEQDLGDHQDLGSVQELYILFGIIAKRASGTGTGGVNRFVEILKKWDDEAKTNTNFKHGRMGIQIDDFSNYDVVPVGTGATQVGLIWKGIDWNNTYAKRPLRADFQIDLIVDKGDDQ